MNKNDIFKKLKQRYNLVQEQGFEVLFISLQGSQNYNQEIYTDEYQSDLDCTAVILPSFNDIINSKEEVSTTIILDNNEHINLKDIRQIFHLYQKQNTQFLETLFSDYIIKNPKYKDYIEDLINMREDIVKINKRSLYMNIIGIAQEKHHSLEHRYPNIADKIDKYGYSGKQLHHQIRVNQLIKNIDSGMLYKEALTYFEPEIAIMLKKAKLNEYDLATARKYDLAFLSDTCSYKHLWDNDKCFDNLEIVNKMMNIKACILRQYFIEQLSLNFSSNNDIDPNKYANVFVTSDTHFGHNNILKLEKRSNFCNNIEEHDEILINNWNKKVKPNDLIYILGDFSFSNYKRTMEILKQLNGDKILIEGNHDCIYLENKHFDKSLFKAIYNYKEISYKDQKICLMHYPIQYFKHQDKDVNYYIHLFGHMHSIPHQIPKRSYNVGVDVNNYEPVKIEDAIERAKLVTTAGKLNIVEEGI